MSITEQVKTNLEHGKKLVKENLEHVRENLEHGKELVKENLEYGKELVESGLEGASEARRAVLAAGKPPTFFPLPQKNPGRRQALACSSVRLSVRWLMTASPSVA